MSFFLRENTGRIFASRRAEINKKDGGRGGKKGGGRDIKKGGKELNKQNRRGWWGTVAALCSSVLEPLVPLCCLAELR